MPKAWENYEEVAACLLNQFSEKFGLNGVFGKQKIPGSITKTEWEIDGKGFNSSTGSIVIVECKRHLSSKKTQGVVGELAYRIIDTGAKGGILVSPLGLQKGASLVAEANNIISVKLRANSSNSDYLMQFLHQVCLGIVDTLEIHPSVTRISLTKVR